MSDIERMTRPEAARLAYRILLLLGDEQAAREGRYAGEPDVSHERFADTVAQLRCYAAVVPDMRPAPKPALPTHDEEGHPFVECEECGKPTLDDNTDECHNPDCPTNERIREKLRQISETPQ